MDDKDQAPRSDLPIEPAGDDPGAAQQDTVQLGPVGQTGNDPSTPVEDTAVFPPAAASPGPFERTVEPPPSEYTPLVGLPFPGLSAETASHQPGSSEDPQPMAPGAWVPSTWVPSGRVPGAPGTAGPDAREAQGGWAPSSPGAGSAGGHGGWIPPSGPGGPYGQAGQGGWIPQGPSGPYGATGPYGPSGSGPNRPRRGWRVITGLAVAVALAGGLGAGLGAAFANAPSSANSSNSIAPSSPQPTPASQAPSKVSQIANNVERAIVNINTNVTTSQGSAPVGAAGTGMILSSNGVVLTNNHVIENAMSIKVSVAGHSGQYNAKVLGTDLTGDVALIKIEGLSNLPHVTLANSSAVQVGEQVIAIGNAGGLGGKQTVVTGAITATNRAITATDNSGALPEHLTGLFQTNADIVPGDSGGPMVNYSGQVIGMDTAAYSADTGVTIGFAIPINTALHIAQQIQQQKASSTVTIGLSPYLGIYEAAQSGGGIGSGSPGGFFGFGNTGGTGNTGTQQVAGVQIGAIVANSPAASAGLQPGDAITSINGQTINTWTELTNAIAKYKPNQKVVITFTNSSGTSSTVTVTLGGIPR